MQPRCNVVYVLAPLLRGILVASCLIDDGAGVKTGRVHRARGDWTDVVDVAAEQTIVMGVSVCLSLSVPDHISGIIRQNSTNYSMHVTCGRGSVLFDGVAIHYILPVLRMTSCFPVMGLMAA